MKIKVHVAFDSARKQEVFETVTLSSAQVKDLIQSEIINKLDYRDGKKFVRKYRDQTK